MNEPHPLVSILVPCRNAAPWLAACLDSALGQTWPNCEVIVADDGSTDGSGEILAAYAGRGVQVLATDSPRNAAAARNRALAAARGEFLQFLDADDLLHPDKIRHQMELLARDRPRTVVLSAIAHFPDGTDPAAADIDEGWPMRTADDPAEWLLDLHGANGPRGMVQTAQWLVPRAVVEAVGPWDESLTLDDDGEYFARVALGSAGIRFARKGLVYFRKHRRGAGNLSARGHDSAEHLRSALSALQKRSEWILVAPPEPVAAQRTMAACFASLAVEAYPRHPEIYEAARAEVQRLGGPFRVPPLGRKTDLLRRLVGWKLARRLSAARHPSPR